MFVTALLTLFLVKFSTAFSDRDKSSDDYVPCERGWYYFREQCYLSEGTKSWTGALAQCKEYGADLVSIQSQEEQDFIDAYLLLGKERVAWIGLNDRDNESDYRWTDGSVFNYTNFFTGQPIAHAEKEEDCVYMYLEPIGTWRNVPCNMYANDYICKKKANTKNRSPDPMYCSPSEGGGWKYEDSCYHIVKEMKSWQKAESHCRNEYKSHLLSVQDRHEDTFLTHALPDIEEEIWIGIQIQDSQQYKWTSGWPVSLDKFDREEKQVEGTCVAMKNKKEWTAIPCSRQLPFICKASNETPPVLKPPPAGSYCPKELDDWRDLGGDYCYFVETKTKVNFSEARSHCRGRGGDLVSLHSQEETDILSPFIKYTGDSIYIGLVRVKGDTGHIFEWSDGSAMDFHNWGYDEPNRMEEECVEALTRTMKWRDTLCENKLSGYICSVKKIMPNSHVVVERAECSTHLSLGSLVGVFVGVQLAIVLVGIGVYYFRPCGRLRQRLSHHLLLRQVDRSTTDLRQNSP